MQIVTFFANLHIIALVFLCKFKNMYSFSFIVLLLFINFATIKRQNVNNNRITITKRKQYGDKQKHFDENVAHGSISYGNTPLVHSL